MSYSCPVSFVQVESNVSRISAFIVASLIISYMLSSNIIILYFVGVDFVTRLFCNKNFSLVFVTARFIKNRLNIEDTFTDSGAKRLAAYFGLLFTALLIAGHFLNLPMFSFVTALVFVTCALLDVIFDFCLGCKIYYIIKKIFPAFMN